MQEDPGLTQDAEDLVTMFSARPRLGDVYVKIRGRDLRIGVETPDCAARTLWRARSIGGGFYEFEVHAGRNRFTKVADCTRLEEVVEAIERSWTMYVRFGRLA